MINIMIKKKIDPHMKAIQELCFLLDRSIYLPIQNEGIPKDLGIRIAMFKGKIEKIIMELKKAESEQYD